MSRPWNPGERKHLRDRYGVTDAEVEQIIREWHCGLQALLHAAERYARDGGTAIPFRLRTSIAERIDKVLHEVLDEVAPTGEVEDR